MKFSAGLKKRTDKKFDLSSFVVFFLILVLFSACSPKPVQIEGETMSPTLRNGDKILIDEKIGEFKRGDIIVFLYPKDTSKWYVKRVLGLPGDKVEITAGRVSINGEVLDEPYLDRSKNQQKGSFAPRVVAENNFYVLGDNRDNSSDSRYWGTVPKELIKGKYYKTYSKAG
jgi:signal peptidase I